MSIPNFIVLFIERLLYVGAVLSGDHAFLPQQHQEIGDVTIPISKMKKVKPKGLMNGAVSHIWFQGLCSLLLYKSFSSRSMSWSSVLHGTLGFVLSLPLPLWGSHADTTFSHRDGPVLLGSWQPALLWTCSLTNERAIYRASGPSHWGRVGRGAVSKEKWAWEVLRVLIDPPPPSNF